VAGAFIRLNGGRLNLETAEQTKDRVANLLKVLRIRSLGAGQIKIGRRVEILLYFRRIWPTMANWPTTARFAS
jgi:hypothetical protein